MKGIVYALYVITLVAFFLTAICIVNGNLKAILPLCIELAAVIILARSVDRNECG